MDGEEFTIEDFLRQQSEGGNPEGIGEWGIQDFSGQSDSGQAEEGLEELESITRVRVKEDKPKKGRLTNQEKYQEAVKSGLEDTFNDIGISLGESGFKTTGYVMLDSSDEFAELLVENFGHRPKIMAALERFSRSTKGIKLGKIAAKIGMSFAVDMGRYDWQSSAADKLGVTEAYMKTHKPGEEPQRAAKLFARPAAPTTFEPIV